jgi:glycosyltransferase involved in cell wall biosynthesis
MRILLLAPQPFYTERGTPIAVRLAATALCRAGHEVDLLTYHEGCDIELPNLRLLRIPRPPLVANVPIGFSWKKVVCDVALTRAAWRELSRRRYDVVHAVEESVFCALLARLRFRFRLVYDMDSAMLDQLVQKWPALRVAAPVLSRFERAAVRGSDLVLAVCPALADYARTFAPPSPVHLLPDVAFPLPPGILAPEPESEGESDRDDLRALFPLSGVLALYVGNLERYQGIDLLLESLALLPEDARCNLAVIGGSEHARRHYEIRAKTLGVSGRVSFPGARPLATLPALLEQADILCSPRLTGSNTPMKIYSYLASGRAILATDITSHSQVLDASSACLVAATPQAYGTALARLAADAPLRERLGREAARLAAEHYSYAAFERRLASAYQALEPAVGLGH